MIAIVAADERGGGEIAAHADDAEQSDVDEAFPPWRAGRCKVDKDTCCHEGTEEDARGGGTDRDYDPSSICHGKRRNNKQCNSLCAMILLLFKKIPVPCYPWHEPCDSIKRASTTSSTDFIRQSNISRACHAT